MLTDHAPTHPPPSGAALRWSGRVAPALLAEQSGRGRRRRWVYVAAGDEHLVIGAAVVDVGLLGLGTAFAFCAGPSLLTPTPRGGWNATTKAAGHRATGTVEHPHGSHELSGAAWTDATEGRQDRHTTWCWAAGAGRSRDGATVGVQASTGMNATGPGEDLVWWDGAPVPLAVGQLAPVDPAVPAGAWRLGGQGWALELEPAGARAATVGFGPIRSRYCQPAGTWRGTLPGPDGTPVPVRLAGVAEDHEARW